MMPPSRYAIGAVTAAKLTMKVRPSRTFRPGAMCVTAWTMLPQKPIAPAWSSVSATTRPPGAPTVGGATASELIDLPPPVWIAASQCSATVGRLLASTAPAKLLSVALVNDGFDRRVGAARRPHLGHRK